MLLSRMPPTLGGPCSAVHKGTRRPASFKPSQFISRRVLRRRLPIHPTDPQWLMTRHPRTPSSKGKARSSSSRTPLQFLRSPTKTLDTKNTIQRKFKDFVKHLADFAGDPCELLCDHHIPRKLQLQYMTGTPDDGRYYRVVSTITSLFHCTKSLNFAVRQSGLRLLQQATVHHRATPQEVRFNAEQASQAV